MSEATNRVTELRAELARAEEAERLERLEAKRAELRAARSKMETDTDEYRQSEYVDFAGPHDSYIGISEWSDGVELNVCEFTSFNTSVTLNREDALALAASIQKFLR
jgi:hypothetical protein